MPALAIPAFWAAIGTGATAAGMAYAAHKSGQASEAQVGQADRGLAAQTEANRRAEQFARQQAEQEYRQHETDRRANYEQWVSQQRRYADIDRLLGFSPRDIPNYVPGQDPGYGGGSSSSPSNSSSTGSSGAGGTGSGTSSSSSTSHYSDPQTASSMFLSSMQKHNLDPVAMQGHGKDIVAALKADYPDLDVRVDPRTDAIVWPGIGPLDVTIDSGKGGWYFNPNTSGTGGSSSGRPPSVGDLLTNSRAAATNFVAPPQTAPFMPMPYLPRRSGSVGSYL